MIGKSDSDTLISVEEKKKPIEGHLVFRTACIDERTNYLRRSERVDLQEKTVSQQ
jgi:hypothetical protein